jgi:hypothetical protein
VWDLVEFFTDNKFVIEAEENLKLVCLGIEQRYYTTQVGDI